MNASQDYFDIYQRANALFDKDQALRHSQRRDGLRMFIANAVFSLSYARIPSSVIAQYREPIEANLRRADRIQAATHALLDELQQLRTTDQSDDKIPDVAYDEIVARLRVIG